MIADQRVEQEGVHVVADAEGEQADVAAGGGVDVIDDRLRIGFAFGGQAVGQEQDGRRALTIRHAERGRQRAVDVGAAIGVLPLIQLIASCAALDDSRLLLKTRQPVLNRITLKRSRLLRWLRT